MLNNDCFIFELCFLRNQMVLTASMICVQSVEVSFGPQTSRLTYSPKTKPKSFFIILTYAFRYAHSVHRKAKTTKQAALQGSTGTHPPLRSVLLPPNTSATALGLPGEQLSRHTPPHLMDTGVPQSFTTLTSYSRY